jgi:hypothetical protein
MSIQKLARLREVGFDFDIQLVLKRGWRIFLEQPLLSISYTMLIISLQLAFFFYLIDFTLIYSLLLAPPLFSGFYLVANRISQRQPVVYPDFFKGFLFFLPVVSIWVIGQVLTGIGLVLFIAPGIYLVAYSFSVLMVQFGGFDFWTAMEESRKLITVKWWKFFLFTLVLIVINVLGALPYGLGLLVTIPVSFYSTYVIFEDLTSEMFMDQV